MDRPVAVITGASQGLGFETARQLLGKGMAVIVTARTAAKAAEGIENLGAPEGAHADELDVGDDGSVAAFFNRLMERHGRIDVLVNNAGRIYGGYGRSIAETPTDLVAEAFNNNTLGAMRMIARALPQMQRKGFGRIVNVSTGMAGLTGNGYGRRALPHLEDGDECDHAHCGRRGRPRYQGEFRLSWLGAHRNGRTGRELGASSKGRQE